jgi:hypothetical protein
MSERTPPAWRRIVAQLRPRCAVCGRWVGVGAQVFYPPGPATWGVPADGPADPVYLCRTCGETEAGANA